ncbi:uncharacterized protein TRIADDRAFT_62403 [Trichoplax adhaerens]|uniref:Uncharacterized protein n=1 Tax=Trichoplax adhaerens TaxID=10228 RepID=B3SDP5_TRIAD|nr:hypothetical protein TRIADDRAFT_62403 [Trichoplax adhaerens]EDV19152.1 hypothetical protein TRIADDRAFT_62403 [Trichoplax adhaerens]|eukprot:XP_002118363.1 hypothetical protein TRIADDRAFT_62403 [Trichoplax adhaerens]
MALEILLMFEQQISYISDEINYHYIKKLADDMTDAIIKAFANEETTSSSNSKPVDLAEFAIKTIASPTFSKKHMTSYLSKGTGSELKVLPEKKKIRASELLKNIGIRTVEDNTVKYYKLKGEKSDICEYGFRQKSFLEGSGSINKKSYELLDSSAIKKNFKYQTQLGKVENVEDLKHYAQNILNEVLVDEKSLIVTMLEKIKGDVHSFNSSNDSVKQLVQENIEKFLETLNVSDFKNCSKDIKELMPMMKENTEKINLLLYHLAEQNGKLFDPNQNVRNLESKNNGTKRTDKKTEDNTENTEMIRSQNQQNGYTSDELKNKNKESDEKQSSKPTAAATSQGKRKGKIDAFNCICNQNQNNDSTMIPK